METIMRITLIKEENLDELFQAMRDLYPESKGYHIDVNKSFVHLGTWNLNVIRKYKFCR